MKARMLCVNCLLPVLFGTGCSALPVSTESINGALIASILGDTQIQAPWRLDMAWQNGDLAGAALRTASIEHVVRKVDKPWFPPATDFKSTAYDFNLDIQNPAKLAIPDEENIERTWRKYCHHQLDMTPDDSALIASTTIPRSVLSRGCTPASLKK